MNTNFEELLAQRVNRLFYDGSRYAAALGFVSFSLLGILQLSGVMKGMGPPILWTLCGGLYSGFVSYLGAKGWLRGRSLYVVVLIYTSLPTALFGLAALTLPSGAATYITGPVTYLYLFMVTVSGFAFNQRLSVLAGAVAGVEYFLVYLLASPQMSAIQTADPLMLQDLTTPPMYFFKSMIMFFTGLVVGRLSNTLKELIFSIVSGEREKTAISRLFGVFVSEEVKQKVILEKTSNIAERKSVAVLFSDIRGFTTLSETYDVEKLVLQLNEYLEQAVQCVTAEGGTVDKFIGDAVMAVFGGLLDLDNPCEAALRAAVQLRGRLQHLNAGWAAQGRPILENGVGIHFGEVVQGTIGSQERKEFTVIGDAVNTASRIEGLCKVLVQPLIFSEAVYSRLGVQSRAASQDLGRHKVKGRDEVVQLYGWSGSPSGG